MNKSVYDTNNNGIIDNAEKVNGHTVNSDVPQNAKFTDTTYSEATTTQNGLMSKEDKAILDKIDEKGYINVFISSYQEINTTQDSIDTNIQFDTRRAYKGAKFTLNSNGTITIGEGVSTIEVSVTAVMKNNTDTATYQRLRLTKNDATLVSTDGKNGTNIYTLSITPIIVNVSKGDIISLKEFNRLKGSTTISVASMTIKEI